MKISNINLKNNLILAPMAGITDLPFRRICEEYEPGLVCTEMVSAKAILYGDEKTQKLLETTGEPRPISMQIFGSDEESMGYAAREVSKKADILDINMGCPAPKVVKNGDGSKLLTDLNKAEKIIKEVVKNSSVPVTVKFRKGWNEENIVAVELAQIAENAGVSAITIHGRTRAEFYSGRADLDIIKKVKEAVKIPVIGNGDVVDEESAKRMLEYTGVDGIMIGRGAMGNPWIFKQINHYLKTGEKIAPPSNKEKFEIMKKHIDLAVETKGEIIAIKEMRKHLACYIKNMENASKIRVEINKIDTYKELIKYLEKQFNVI